jgi:hypothetical protein
VRELKTIRDFIEPSGYLYLELPYEKIMEATTSLIDKLSSKRHWHEHINFFSEKAIKSMLSEAGFSVICCEVKEPAAPGNFEKVLFVIAQKN